jgi:hypothetical protein
MSRQARLTEPEPLTLNALIDHSVICRVVGGPLVMVEQLNHLLEMGTHDNVTIQIVPFTAGSYGTMSGPFTIIGYADDDLPAVYLEHAAGGVWVENDNDVGRFGAMFDEIAGLALTCEDSTALIADQVRELETRARTAASSCDYHSGTPPVYHRVCGSKDDQSRRADSCPARSAGR